MGQDSDEPLLSPEQGGQIFRLSCEGRCCREEIPLNLFDLHLLWSWGSSIVCHSPSRTVAVVLVRLKPSFAWLSSNENWSLGKSN